MYEAGTAQDRIIKMWLEQLLTVEEISKSTELSKSYIKKVIAAYTDYLFKQALKQVIKEDIVKLGDPKLQDHPVLKANQASWDAPIEAGKKSKPRG